MLAIFRCRIFCLLVFYPKFKVIHNHNFVFLYGCETWSLIFREEHKVRVCENRVLRRLFGPERDEVTGVWRERYNEEFHDLYYSPTIVRVIKSRRML
jgi:hypothetical protein